MASQLSTDQNRRLKQLLQAHTKALRQAAATVETHYKGSFRKGGYADGNKWKKRHADNQDPGRATLVKSGDLRRSLKARVVGKRAIVLSSDVPYAQIHNEGGTIIQKPTFKQRMYFSELSDQFRKEGNNRLANKFAAMSRAKQLVINIDQRQFMPIEGQDQISKELETKIINVIKKNIDAVYAN